MCEKAGVSGTGAKAQLIFTLDIRRDHGLVDTNRVRARRITQAWHYLFVEDRTSA